MVTWLIPAALAAVLPAATGEPVLSMSHVLVQEGDAGAVGATFVVALTGPTPVDVEVEVSTADGTAKDGVDYGGVTTTLVFPASTAERQERTVKVPIYGDVEAEGTEYFLVALSQAATAEPTGVWAYGVIEDDDGAPAAAPRCDLNHDGRSDLMVRSRFAEGRPEDRNDPWYFNGPIGTPGGGSTPFRSLGQRAVATGDFDGDGECDLLWQLDDRFLVTFPALSGGSLLPPGGEPGVLPPASWELDFGGALDPVGLQLVGTGDFDGDGASDLMWWDPAGGRLVAWLVTESAGAVLPTVPDGSPGPLWLPAATPDLDGDGRPDVLWRNEVSGELVVWWMDGLTRRAVESLQPAAVSDLNWQLVGTGDLDGDGRDDLIWRHRLSHRVVFWFMAAAVRRSGAFASPDRFDDPPWQATIVGPR